ncbi:hypothetical protein CU254_41325 (plasmid) [Amycolatopsis sp. AA4]|uniref:hypothetical protein n=1 Tax=Actinomycetes TaxID=1760 RepID=UPI0001B55C12|nr:MULTISPECIES: hypothetical protein [Actinomycetes]ATY17030.1 hypothetical protein CU254_41325 [Amycolatopsis sp. AA4]EFL12478.1 predicted protein [Streptomyces sp. AA4]
MTVHLPLAADIGQPHPEALVLTAAVLVAAGAALAALARARRPVPPPRGHLTVHELAARLAQEAPPDDAVSTIPIPRTEAPDADVRAAPARDTRATPVLHAPRPRRYTDHARIPGPGRMPLAPQHPCTEDSGGGPAPATRWPQDDPDDPSRSRHPRTDKETTPR